MGKHVVVVCSSGTFIGCPIGLPDDCVGVDGKVTLLDTRRVLRCASPDELAVFGFVKTCTALGPLVSGRTELREVRLVHPIRANVVDSLYNDKPTESP